MHSVSECEMTIPASVSYRAFKIMPTPDEILTVAALTKVKNVYTMGVVAEWKTGAIAVVSRIASGVRAAFGVVPLDGDVQVRVAAWQGRSLDQDGRGCEDIGGKRAEMHSGQCCSR